MTSPQCPAGRSWMARLVLAAGAGAVPLAATRAADHASPPAAPAATPAPAAVNSNAAANVNEGFVVRDAAAFAACVDVGSAKLEKLGGGMQFVEGPVWVAQPKLVATDKPAAGGFLVFSDIPADELKRWTRAEGVTTYRPKPPAGTFVMSNGNALDAEGRLVTCAQAGRTVYRTEKDGTTATLADAFEGKKFNSPNDLVISAAGAIYFTDPPYGLPKGVKSELGFRGVYKLDPATKALSVLVKDLDYPNGIAQSPDERTLYVAMSDGRRPIIRAYPLKPDGTLAGDGRDLCRIDKGGPDGIKVDAAGRIWSSAGDGVHVFAPDGKLLGKILVPEGPANLCFGGPDGRTLFITAKTSLYAIPVKTTGAERAKMKAEG